LEVKLAELLSLKPEDERRLNSHALVRFNDWNTRILEKVPKLCQLSIEQIKADLGIYLDSYDRAEFNKCFADITRWLSRCMDTGEGYCSDAYDTWVINPMLRVESLIIRAYQKAEEERRKKEREDRCRVAFIAIDPPVDNVKTYLNNCKCDCIICPIS
jgi:hypothetical protein